MERWRSVRALCPFSISTPPHGSSPSSVRLRSLVPVTGRQHRAHPPTQGWRGASSASRALRAPQLWKQTRGRACLSAHTVGVTALHMTLQSWKHQGCRFLICEVTVKVGDTLLPAVFVHSRYRPTADCTLSSSAVICCASVRAMEACVCPHARADSSGDRGDDL